MKIDKKDRRADPNNVYVTVIGKSVNLRSVLLKNFEFNRQEGVSNRLLNIRVKISMVIVTCV